MKQREIIFFVLMALGPIWYCVMEWMRHRSWQKTRDTGFSPSTQHLALIGIIGALAFLIAAAIARFRH
jgi:hypothetical protein